MLNLNDIIALAKQGYKPADIKELIELSKTAEASEDQGAQPIETTPETEKAEEKETPKEEAPKEETKKDGAGEADKIVDYKAKAEELEKKILELQKANTKQNADKSEEKSDAELFADVMKSFM